MINLKQDKSDFDQFFEEKDTIFAGIIRSAFKNNNDWTIVSKGVHKTITREDGLSIKKLFDMRSTSTGYEGYVDPIVYKNGGKIRKFGRWITL